jgi:hypothetical protein
MLETENSIVNLDTNVSPMVLAGILGVNVSLLYQNMQAGIFIKDLTLYTYREAIQTYITYYKKATELKKLKAQQEKEALEEKLETAKKLREAREREQDKGSKYGDFDDEMTKLTMAKLSQGIKLDRVREEQLWLKIAIDRKDYIDISEIVELAEPFLLSIRNILINIAATTPELEKQIDQAMETIYNLGITLVDEAEEDSKRFVQDMLAREVYE